MDFGPIGDLSSWLGVAVAGPRAILIPTLSVRACFVNRKPRLVFSQLTDSFESV